MSEILAFVYYLPRLALAFLAALPELLRLIDNIQKQIEADKTDRRVKEDLQKINQAFKDKDAEALKRIFTNS